MAASLGCIGGLCPGEGRRGRGENEGRSSSTELITSSTPADPCSLLLSFMPHADVDFSFRFLFLFFFDSFLIPAHHAIRGNPPREARNGMAQPRASGETHGVSPSDPQRSQCGGHSEMRPKKHQPAAHHSSRSVQNLSWICEVMLRVFVRSWSEIMFLFHGYVFRLLYGLREV